MGTNTPKKNRLDETMADQKLLDGFNKNAAAIPSVVVSGTTVTTKDIVATLQARIDSAKAVLSTRATWQATVQADRAERDKTKTFVSGLRQSVLVAFAGKIDTLADFGLTPRKALVLSPGAMVARTQKVIATRAARHTMGSKQKAAVKGTVATTAPVTAPAAAPSSGPAPVAPVAAPVAPAPQPVMPVASPVAPVPQPAVPVALVAAPVAPVPQPATPVVSPVVAPTPSPAPVAPAPASPVAAPPSAASAPLATHTQ